MTTPIKVASAQIFVSILRQVASLGIQNQWLIPTTDLSTLLPERLKSAIVANQGKVYLQHSVTSLEITEDICTAVDCKGTKWQAENVVLAVSAWQAAKLTAAHQILTHTTWQLQQFSFQPITTIYYEFTQDITLPYPILGMINSYAQWVFSRACLGQANILCAVISGYTDFSFSTQDELATEVLKELQRQIVFLPSCIGYKVICEKRAAFECNVAIQAIRPVAATNVRNLWLCGDYVQNGLPATLEGAVSNGEMVANLVLSELGKSLELYRLAQTNFCDDSNLVGNKTKQGDMSLS